MSLENQAWLIWVPLTIFASVFQRQPDIEVSTKKPNISWLNQIDV